MSAASDSETAWPSDVVLRARFESNRQHTSTHAKRSARPKGSTRRFNRKVQPFDERATPSWWSALVAQRAGRAEHRADGIGAAGGGEYARRRPGRSGRRSGGGCGWTPGPGGGRSACPRSRPGPAEVDVREASRTYRRSPSVVPNSTRAAV
eukprot:1180047-Prorocentrum_minimum.AAC.2